MFSLSVANRLYSAPLEFLQFTSGNLGFIALLDSGAQLNVMNGKLLHGLTYDSIEIPVFCVYGMQGSASKIDKWIILKIVLANGQSIDVTFAIMNDVPNLIILGRPFLLQVEAVVDHVNCLMATKLGTVSLIEKTPTTTRPSCSLITMKEFDCQQLSLGEKTELDAILRKYEKIWDKHRIGISTTIYHKIELTTTRPLVCRPRRHSAREQIEISREINKMLSDKIIRVSDSPYASEIVLVKKKTGEWRVCVDYRQINEKTVPDRYPLPRISDLLRSIGNSRFFVTLDLRAGYWQIPMHQESKKITAFRCPSGLYEFQVMPFGLTNAPATFQRLMDSLFGELRYNGVLVYLDDILVHGVTFTDVHEKLSRVFNIIDAAGLTLNLEKCQFFPKVLKYLGHVVKDGVLSPDIDKVAVLRRIAKPNTNSDVRSLLGALGYYQKFIKDFSSVMAPIFDILRDTPNSKRNNKSTTVIWNAVHEQALAEAIKRLEISVLQIPLDSDEFLLETDASNIAVGAILNCKQECGNWAPVEFASKKLSETQQRWPTREKEAFAIIFGLNKFEQYLRGRSFDVHTDHESLKWMVTAKTGKIARWASRLAEFDMRIRHRKGQDMIHVDFLSRFIEDENDCDLAPRMTCYVIRTELPSICEILQLQRTSGSPVGKGFFYRDGRWYFRDGIWVPKDLQLQTIAACHSTTPFRHPGVKKTKGIVTKVFNWPNLHQDVTDFIKSCLPCQRVRPGLDRLQGLFRMHPVPGPFQTVYMDYWSCSYKGTTEVVLTIIDQFTKWAECVSIANKTEAVVTSSFIKSWVCRFGVPKTIITDNDKVFIGALFRRICSRLGINNLRTTVYHPEGNAPIESFHRVLKKGFLHFAQVSEDNIPFDEVLQLILLGYRSVVHSTTNETPGFLLYGVDLRPALDNDWRYCRSTDEKQRLEFLNNMRLDVQYQAIRSIMKKNKEKNEGRKDAAFQLNDLVLTRNTPFEMSQMVHFSGEHGCKLIPRWSTPSRVIKISPGNKTAIVKNIISGKIKEVHLQNARPINAPVADCQREEWEKVMLLDGLSMHDKDARRKILQDFWEEVGTPQTDDMRLGGVKRRRS